MRIEAFPDPIGRFHAVLDGAHFDDLPGLLDVTGLDVRPLYLGENTAFGPHLVHPRSLYQIERVLEIVGAAPAAVWWDWPDDAADAEARLYRHLRRIAMIEVPADRLPLRRGEAPPPPTAYRRILFRHADPRVLAITVPELTAPQLAQLMGAAYALLFDDPEEGPKIAYHPEIERRRPVS